MKNIEILSTGSYIPKKIIKNNQFNNIEKGYIEKRTGIQTRYYVEDETHISMSVQASIKAIEKAKINPQQIDFIIVATTTTSNLMPGISYLVQKELKIKKSMCLDILAGCNGYINAFDIARNYILIGKVKKALIIGVDILSKCIDKDDIGTSIMLSDGAGATIIQETKDNKKYDSNIESDGANSEILTCNTNSKIYMNGIAIYKYAVTQTVINIQSLLKQNNENIENIKYIIPHQSNMKIINAIATRLGIKKEKMYVNINKVGNTFCASIPIALNEMFDKQLIQKGDKIILLGYGGGLNTGSILMEV